MQSRDSLTFRRTCCVVAVVVGRQQRSCCALQTCADGDDAATEHG